MAARWKKIGLIAGGGQLPIRIIAERKALGEDFHLIRLQGLADEPLSAEQGEDIAIGEAGKIIRSLKEAHCDAVCLAGIVRRPDFSSLNVDWRGAALLPKLAKAAMRGDGAILDVLVATFESENFLVVGADEIVGGLAASAGAMGKCASTPADINDISKAANIIDALGNYDVGQAAVVASGHVLAIEAAEGTDLMLARCAHLPGEEGASEKRGVLVKCPKPGQELRVDLPVIGPDTVRAAIAARLRGIAVKADAALIMNRDEMIEAADEAGLFVFGFTSADLTGQ